MALPGNGIFVVRGEMSTLMTAMRRGARWSSTSYQDEEQDALMKQFIELKQILNQIEDLRLIDPNVFLGPFLEVIRTEETTGAVTSLSLSAVNKFLSYGLIDPTHPTLAVTVENIADAVTHARFMGTDQASDGVTLMRVVEVLHTLMRSPEGSALTNESVCEVMLSCFKICFEPRLNELLRRTAEQALKDMVLLLFMRLPQFSEERYTSGLLRKFKMMAGSIEQMTKKKKSKSAQKQNISKPNVPRISSIKNEEKPPTNSATATDPKSPNLSVQQLKPPILATTPATPGGNIVDMQGKITQTPTTSQLVEGAGDVAVVNEPLSLDAEQEEKLLKLEESVDNDADVEDELVADVKDGGKPNNEGGEYINSVGVRFTHQKSVDGNGANPLLPYGLPCIQELFRFLILLCNPLDKQNTDTMMHMGLSLLTVAFEVAADNIGKYDTLLALVKDEMCRNLFALLNSERLTIFAADLQVCFLLFESLRLHLKFQLEFYLTKLSEIIASENPRTPYEMRELALDNLLQLWRIPGFVAELYVNYDCDLYCSDLFESLTKLLSKNTLSATSAIYSTHVFSMDTLVSVIENVEKNCAAAKSGNISLQSTTRHSRNNSGVEAITIEADLNASSNESSGVENITSFIYKHKEKKQLDAQKISKEELAGLKNKKRILAQGTDLFNQRPEKGIQFLQENGIFKPVLDPMEIALFLRENPGLDKKMIGDYISKKKNVESKILENFVKSFDFANMRIDQALRLYLETFRLPGEAPLIFLVMEHFAEHWHKCNHEPFANTDAAFRLAYSIIMLNMDQHNYNAKRLNVPMTPEDFLKNLRGLNGNKDFDQDMLSNIFSATKNEEIVMPAEQTGIVRENYLWKVLLRRGVGKDGIFYHVYDSSYDKELFNIIWGSSLAALSFMFDKSSENGFHKTLTGFKKCAGISAFYNLHEDFDALILTLCKFTTLLSIQQDANDITVAVSFGLNQKAQAAMKTVFCLVHDYGDCLRESWKNILEVIVQLFRLKLLPKSLMEVEDFCEPNGKATLILEKPSQKPEAGLFSSLYSYLSSEGQREPTYEEQEIMKIAKKCIRECQIDQIISESKFVQFESLQELLKCFLNSLKPPNVHKSVGLSYSEDTVVFLMETLVRIVIQNRDRMIPLWTTCRDQIYLLLMGGASCGYDYLLNRTTVALLKLAIYLMRNEELCPIVLQSLKMLLMLKPNVLYRISKQISIGMYELLKTSAQNIHTEADWQIIFALLECIGAGAVPPDFEDGPPPVGTKSDGALSSEEDSGLPDRGYISDSEVVNAKSVTNSPSSTPFSPSGENWILVNKDSELSVSTRPQSPIGSSLVYPCKLLDHLPFALFKCWDSLAFIVRNVAHITPYNFESCVRCIRTFVEACLDGGIKIRRKLDAGKIHRKKSQRKDTSRNRKRDDNSSESEDEELNQRYETLAIQLLDLMYTLYTRTAQIFRWWAEEGCAVPQCSALWAQGWCPLLQGIARLAMDRRREVRTYAISCLQQRALLVHDLQTLSGSEWASCFKQVLFPLLTELLPESASIAYIDPVLLEESRIRTATIMSKVFLHHLTPLIELSTFHDLWVEILDYIEKFMKVGSDMLYEQMLEILKNMLLVMHSVRIFHYNDGTTHSPLWELTWKRIGEFLPNLKDELFKEEVNRSHMAMTQIPSQSDVGSSQYIHAISAAISTSTMVPNVAGDIHLQGALRKSDMETLAPACVKGSIILQPPVDILAGQRVILGQANSTPQQNVPILIPQAQLHPHQMGMTNTSKIGTPTASHHSSSVLSACPQQAPVFYSSKTDASLPDLVNDASKIIDSGNTYITTPGGTPKRDTGFSGNVYQIRNNTEFSNVIELPETPPPAPHKPENQTQDVGVNEIDNKQLNDYIQPNVEELGVKYQQPFIQQSHHQQQQCENHYHHPLSPQHYRDEQHQYLENHQFTMPNDQPLESTNESMINVPISHLIAGTQYPSLNKIPPSAIVQSFSPVYVQAQVPQSGTDIYSDYVQNPYNLTLQQSHSSIGSDSTGNFQNSAKEDAGRDEPKTQVLGVSNMFQSANYFGGVDQSTIPPGSEMLFGQP